MMESPQCPLCIRIQRVQKDEEPLLIQSFEASYLFLGDHQFYKGYCVLVAKRCVREIIDLPENEGLFLWRELMNSARAIQNAFRPWKLNYASLGNQCPHLHWHIFPRSENDPHRREHPWFHHSEFAKHSSFEGDHSFTIELIQRSL